MSTSARTLLSTLRRTLIISPSRGRRKRASCHRLREDNRCYDIQCIVDCMKKANKRLYFIVLLKRARVPLNDIVNFYCTTIRPVLEYCSPVFHHALSAYLNEDIERIQKRVLSIISPDMSYRVYLDSLGLPTLYDRRNELCRQLFDSIAINPGHKVYNLVPPRNQSSYNLRRQKTYNLPYLRAAHKCS